MYREGRNISFFIALEMHSEKKYTGGRGEKGKEYLE